MKRSSGFILALFIFSFGVMAVPVSKYGDSKFVGIVEKHVKSWTDNNKIPSWDNKHEGYKDLFDELKKEGFFASDTEYKHHIFAISHDFSKSGRLSVRVPSPGGDKTIGFSIEDNSVTEASFVSREGARRSGNLIIYRNGDGLTDGEKSKLYEKDIKLCRMNTPKILRIVESHARKWKKEKKIPSWENNHAGYEDLFNDLRKENFFSMGEEYAHHVFGRSHTFDSNQYGFPQLTIKSDDDLYEYNFDMDKDPPEMVARTNQCTEKELNQLIREYSAFIASKKESKSGNGGSGSKVKGI